MQQDNSEQVILDPKLIAKDYIRTWFFLGENPYEREPFMLVIFWNNSTAFKPKRGYVDLADQQTRWFFYALRCDVDPSHTTQIMFEKISIS